MSPAPTGLLAGRLPYRRLGYGAQPLLLLHGFWFESRLPSGLALQLLRRCVRPLVERYSVHLVTYRSDLPPGVSTRDMAADCARALAAELDGPVDVIGLSTGGGIAQHLAADHPEVVRRLVLGSSAHRLGLRGQAVLQRCRELARDEQWRTLRTASALATASPLAQRLLAPALWLIEPELERRPPAPEGVRAAIEAHRVHEGRPRLDAIRAPTLVIAGEDDRIYPIDLVQETAAGIRGAWLELLPRTDHRFGRAARQRFGEIVGEFLADGDAPAVRPERRRAKAA